MDWYLTLVLPYYGDKKMITQKTEPSKKSLYASVTGVILLALCCFTPLLVIGLGAIGLSFFTPYLDFILLPAMALMIIYAFYSYKKWKGDCKC